MEKHSFQEKIKQVFGIAELNVQQKAMLHTSKSHQNIVLLAPTGSGKTLAFAIPLLESIEAGKGLQACILSPTRELALQISEVIVKSQSGARILTIYGGHSFGSESLSLTTLPDILVATPGRLLDHLRRGNIPSNAVRTIVVDEFDKMLEMGFEEQVKEVLTLFTPERQWFISATGKNFNLPSDNFEWLDFSESNEPQLSYYAIECREKEKMFVLADTLCSLPTASTIIFCNHREMVEKVCDFLNNEGIRAVAYHGGLEQDERERALIRFRNKSANYMVSTDLGSRGIDVSDVEHVIHYQFPESGEAFVHRNGRTGRSEKSGEVYWLLNETEKTPEYLPPSGTFVPDENAPLPDKPQFETIYFGAGKKDKINKGDIVGFLAANSSLRPYEIGMITSQDRATYVAIPADLTTDTLKSVWDKKIKGKRVKIARAR